MKKFTLTVRGIERTFSEEDLIFILEEYEKRTRPTKKIIGPQEEVLFEVNPLKIDRSLFKNKRENKLEEQTRQLILESLEWVDEFPRTYARPFKTLMPKVPKKHKEGKTYYELGRLAQERGGEMANWIEQALEWAQRMTNGETWEDICKVPDTANWYRIIRWKDDDHAAIVGGSYKCKNYDSPADVEVIFKYSDILTCTIPLIVMFK